MNRHLVFALCSLSLACGSGNGSHDAPADRPATIPDAPLALDARDSAVVADTPMLPDASVADQAPGLDVSIAEVAVDLAAPLPADAGSEAGAVAVDGSSEVGTVAVDGGHETGVLDGGGEAGMAGVPTRLVLSAAPGTIIAAAYEDTLIFGQLQDAAGNPVLTTVAQTAPIKATLASSNEQVLLPYYSAGDERGTLVFEKVNHPNWAYTFFKATSTPGSATVSGSAPGLTVVPVTVNTVAKGGAATALRIFAEPTRVPAAGVRDWFPVIQIVDGSGLPTYRTASFDVTIASDNAAVSTGGSLYFNSSFNRMSATIGVPAAVGTATLTASAAGLASGATTLTVLP